MSLTQSTDHQEYAHISGCIVDRNRGARHSNVSLRTGRDIDVIVSRAIVTNILEGLG